ncbi:MAG: protein kinase [Bacteroidetes bacterium]|nr:protein kinase [Bacteroidota bacterium]MBU1677865.1 protein kinase [Bacteroidota bacterium]
MDEFIGKRIENYKIISLLGKGGMGMVYKAFDEKLDRYVAIKVLSDKIPDNPRFIERFKREAKNQAQLAHPNIVTVYGFIEYDNLLGIVMEYVDGESLEKVIKRQRRLHIFDVVYIMKQLLKGMGHAHSKGFVHRDIKPSNIILNSEGIVKIMDFGISKALNEKGVTRTGAKVGTVYYMSPEQVRGKEITLTTDIYAIGCTMYEMLAGTAPFVYESEYDIMEAHLKKEPAKLSQHLPAVPEQLEKIVSTAMQKNVEDRFQSCISMLDALANLDSYLADLQSKYFVRIVEDPKKTRIKSVFATVFLIVTLSFLTVFVFNQVDELLRSNQMPDLQRYNFETLFKEGEAGVTFTKLLSSESNTKFNINSIKFVDESFGFAVGDSGTLLVTVDSAKTWIPRNLNTKFNLSDAYFFSDGRSFIVGEKGMLMTSKDFFTTSSLASLDRSSALFKIYFIDKYSGYILGSNGLIFRTENGGENWFKLNSSSNNNLFDLSFINENKGFIIGWRGTILETDDSGQNWLPIKSFTTKYLKSIDFYDENLGLVVGGAGSIFRTEDGGETWTKIEFKNIGGLQKVEFLNEYIALAVGTKGIICISHDRGKSWKQIESNFFNNLNDFFRTAGNKVFIVGANGTILKLM